MTVSDGEASAIDDASGLLTEAPFPLFACHPDGTIGFWNRAAEMLLGWSAGEAIGTRLAGAAVEGGNGRGDEPHHDIVTMTHRDGTTVSVERTQVVLADEHDHPIGTLVMLADRSAGAPERELVRMAEDTWQTHAMRVVDAISFVDEDARAFRSINSHGMKDLAHRGDTGRVDLHPDDVERAVAAWRRVCAVPGRREQVVVRVRYRDGHYEQLELTEVNLLDDPQIGSIAVATSHVAERLHNERLVQDEAHILELIARDTDLDEVLPALVHMAEYHCGSIAAVLTLDDGGSLRLRSAPSVAEGLAKLVSAEHLPVDPGPNRDYPTLLDPIAISIAQVHEIAPDQGSENWAPELLAAGFQSLWTNPVRDRGTGNLFGVLVNLVTESRRPTDYERRACEVVGHLIAIAIERSEWQRRVWIEARFDRLTQLPNRAHIFEQLDRLLAEARVARAPVTALVLDLDRFRVINDSLGHSVGDELLVRFARRLQEAVGDVELVGRIAADEFVVAFPAGVRVREAKLAAGRVAEALTRPFRIADDDIYLTASFGIASSAKSQENADTLLQRADTAMFRAKVLGRDRVEVYDDRLRSRAVRRLEVDRELRVALERGELELHYQPEIDCRTGQTVGAEALLRWNHPTRGLIHPDGFIHVAEESGIIVPIGHWVLDEAVRQARTWSDALPEIAPFAISVNLSARQLINRSLVDAVAFALTRYAWPPSQLTLELTESILIEDRDATLYVLNRLRMLGVKLAIDDFGTGFASLDYLHRLHVDWIKIDRSFVKMLDADGSGSPVATAMMHMARDFELLVTAEGVEEQRQFDGLKAIGCDLAQGFLFAKPLPADDFEVMLRSNRIW